MRVYIAADHNGWEMKRALAAWLQEQAYEIEDLGAEALNPQDDYPDFAAAAARAVAEDPANRRGLLICGSGAGMAAAAGKIAGIRAALIHDPAIARAARHDDDINVLALGAKFIDLEKAKAVVSAWLGTAYAADERFERRLKKIAALE